MPELPEVETVRQTLRNFVLGHHIEAIDVLWPNMIDGDIEQFKNQLVGQTIHEISRKGKYLIFIFDDVAMISHLRMEGKYLYETTDTSIEKHSHVLFHLDRGMDLRYHDVRKFGRLEIVSKENYLDELPLSKLGPEPFDLDWKEFKKSIQTSHLPVKTVLLDQTKIAGLGNIYANEVLYRAKIHPMTKASDLSDARIKKIIEMSCEVLNEAIQMGGTTIRSFSSNGIHGLFSQKLDVHGRFKETCHRCGHTITKKKINGRTAYYCSHCQKIARKRGTTS